MPRKKTTEEFVRDANLIHDNFYNYDKTLYDGIQVPVEIECPIHGMFTQKPAEHMSGNGCQKCGLEKRITSAKKSRGVTTDSLIRRAKKTHGDRYDYSNVKYNSCREPVEIVCEKHGVFQQLLHNHIHAAGCPQCANDQRSEDKKLKLEDFIRRATEKHNGFYDYSKSEIITSHSKTTVVCPEHGEFLTTPSRHMSGIGCPTCGLQKLSRKFSMGREEFIRRAREVHGYRYGYDRVAYVNNSVEVEIECKEHGVFKQRPGVHLKGCGCVRCNKRLHDKDYWVLFPETHLYLFEIITPEMDHQFLKVGISQTPISRASGIARELDGAYVGVVKCLYGDSKLICDFEEYLHKDSHLDHTFIGKKFGGFTECYPIKYYQEILEILDEFNRNTEGVQEVCL